MRRFEEAIDWADRSLNHEPNFTPVLRVKLVACAQLGRLDEARQCRRRVDELQPGLTIAQLRNYPGMSVSPDIMNLFADGFRKVGVPEE